MNTFRLVIELDKSFPEWHKYNEIIGPGDYLTPEYTGQDKHVCYLVPQWKEILNFDTHAKGENSTFSKIVDGSLFGYIYSGIAGVSNIGDDNNWTGHHLAQANFYGFGRLKWNPGLFTQQITHEWITQTLGHNKKVTLVTNLNNKLVMLKNGEIQLIHTFSGCQI